MKNSFKFDLTEQDYLDFNMFTVRGYRFYKTQRFFARVLFALAPLGVWLYEYIRTNGGEIPEFQPILLGIMAGLSVVFWAYLPKFYDFLILFNAKRILFKEGKRNILGERILTFEDDQIHMVTQFEDTSMKYGIIIGIKESDSGVYLYVSPEMGIIVPTRVFESEQEKSEFLQFIESRI